MRGITIPKVRGRSGNNIEHVAVLLLNQFSPRSLQNIEPIDLIDLFEGRALRSMGFEYGVEDLPPGMDGKTDFAERRCVVSAETYDGADLDGRSRFTIGHEIGHVCLHRKELIGILEEQRRPATFFRKDIPAYLDPEWQANRFSGALLMPLHHMIKLLKDGADERDVMSLFRVSFQAAEIRIREVKKTRPSEDLFMHKS